MRPLGRVALAAAVLATASAAGLAAFATSIVGTYGERVRVLRRACALRRSMRRAGSTPAERDAARAALAKLAYIHRVSEVEMDVFDGATTPSDPLAAFALRAARAARTEARAQGEESQQAGSEGIDVRLRLAESLLAYVAALEARAQAIDPEGKGA